MLALLFPGQGSQTVGMGQDVYGTSSAARAVFDSADDALSFSLTRCCFEGPDDVLRRTEIQQPAILATSVALLRALEERSTFAPAFVAGHSLGEYTALVASGALRFEDAVRLVRARARFMQEAVPEGLGAMAAVIGCDRGAVEAACEAARRDTGQLVAPANYNAPQQTVISGEAGAVETACMRARELGARRTIRLAVSAPFHCALMVPAAEKLGPELARIEFRDPRPPVVTNVEAAPNTDGRRVAELLHRQVTEPVRWTELIGRLVGLGVSRVLEVGPGRVLIPLVARTAKQLACAHLANANELEPSVRFAAEAAG